MNHAINICLPCGLCCDGTLIGFVQLDRDEMPALKKIMDIEDEDGNGFFLHPCKKYCAGCTIYEDRPKQCDKFKCKLLNAVNQNELEFDKAENVIKEVKQRKASIEKKIALELFKLQSPSFYFQIVELKKILHKNTLNVSSTQNQLELGTELEQLDSLLKEYFGVTLN